MAKLGFTIDATKENLSQGHAGLPIGLKIPVEIKKVELELTRDRQGGKMVFTVGIFDGPFKGREGAIQLNVKNKSEDAQRIGREQVAKIATCVGISKPVESTEDFKPGARFLIDTEAKELENGASVGELRRIFSLSGSQPSEVLTLIKAGKFKEAAAFDPAKFKSEWAQAAEKPANTAHNEDAGGWGAPPPTTAKAAATKPGKPAKTEPPAADESGWGSMEAEEVEAEPSAPEVEEESGDDDGFSWG